MTNNIGDVATIVTQTVRAAPLGWQALADRRAAHRTATLA